MWVFVLASASGPPLSAALAPVWIDQASGQTAGLRARRATLKATKAGRAAARNDLFRTPVALEKRCTPKLTAESALLQAAVPAMLKLADAGAGQA